MLAVFVPLTVVASLATAGNRLVTALAMTGAFTVLIIVAMAMWDFRPSWWIHQAALLRGLEAEERRRVTAAVRSGQAVDDPRLAEVASAVAARTARATWLLIAAGAVNLVIRLGFLVGAGDGRPLVLELLATGAWSVYLVFGIHRLTRARRAEVANRGVLAAVGRQ